MAVEKSPAFQFYPKDFLSDPNVAAMSHSERGIYITLLCYCWLNGSLPADPRLLAQLVGEPMRAFRLHWRQSLQRCFSTKEDGRLIQKRLEVERTKQQAFREKQAQKGQKSAAARQRLSFNRG